MFCDIFLRHYENCFPAIKTKNRSHHSKPRLTQGLINSIRKKNKLYKKYLRCKSATSNSTYKKYKNKLSKILIKAERAYYANKFNSCRGNCKETWKALNQILNKSKTQTFPDSIQIGDSTVTDNNKIAEEFNTYFTNIGSQLAGKIPASIKHYTEYLPPMTEESFFIYPSTKEEIELIVKNFDGHKSCGFDNISPKVIKAIVCDISEILCHIFNLSFRTGIVPVGLKTARVFPIYKGGAIESLANYRPISVLPCLSKILERLMHKRLSNFLTKHNIINKRQFGFREKHSTAMALNIIVDEIAKSLDSNDVTYGIFLDLAKAFDTVNHKILTGKLQHYGVRGVPSDWFNSYLSERKQTVMFKNSASSYMDVNCGVPQGSVLGRLLFIIYINDCSNISDVIDFVQFADDTNVFTSGKDPQALSNTVNSELVKLSNWFRDNKLSLNIEKTKFIYFSKRKKKN